MYRTGPRFSTILNHGDGLPDKSLFGTKNLRVKLAELQMNMICSSFKSIEQELKAKQDKAALAYQELGKLPSNLPEKRFLFQRIKEEISNGVSSITLGGRICSTQNDRKMRPSAEFQLNAYSYQTSLNSCKLANISEVVVGSKVIVLDGECEVRGEVVFINDNDDVFIKQVVAKNVHTFSSKICRSRVIFLRRPMEACTHRQTRYPLMDRRQLPMPLVPQIGAPVMLASLQCHLRVHQSICD